MYTCGREEYPKCLDEHVSQVNSDSAPPAVYTKLFVALQSTVYSGLDNTVVDNNEEAIFTSLVPKIVREEPLMLKLLNGWAGSNFTRHAQSPKVQSVLTSTSIWMSVCEEQLVFKLLNGWTDKHFTSRVLAFLFRRGKFLAPKHSNGTQRESSHFRPASNVTQYWPTNAPPKTANDSRCRGMTTAVNLKKALDLEITKSFSVPVEGGHDIVRGTVIDDELLAKQHRSPKSKKQQLTFRPW